MAFKLEYRDEKLQQNGRRRNSSSNSASGSNNSNLYYRRSGSRKVSSKQKVVDSIHPVSDLISRRKIQPDLFYSQNELQLFLGEFVTSLHEQEESHTTTITPST
jgi:hypothetical protein